MKSLIFLLSSMLLFSSAAYAAVPLVERVPMAVPAGADQKMVVRAIKGALAGRGWRVVAEQPGRIDATLNVRNKHTVNVEIDYGPSELGIKYVSSVNLDYSIKDGVPMIHRNYAKWVNLLLDDAGKNLAMAGAH